MTTESARAFRGIGPRSAGMLHATGIATLNQLQDIGAVRAYALVKRTNCKRSLNLLWALEGAISGEHWLLIAKSHRTSLLLALEDAEKNA